MLSPNRFSTPRLQEAFCGEVLETGYARDDELASLLRDLAGVPPEYASRHERFAATFCEFDDGAAAARVMDRTFA